MAQALRKNRVTIYAGSILMTDRCSTKDVAELKFLDSESVGVGINLSVVSLLVSLMMFWTMFV